MSDYGDVSEHLRAFRRALADEPDDALIVRERVLHGGAFAVPDDQSFQIKLQIATEFGADVNTDLFVVGSAKLGFSIAPKKRYAPFGDHSDIDVAVVNHELYQQVWHEIHKYADSGSDWPKRAAFEERLAWGWIRPDLLPRSPSFAFANRWWDFFRGMQSRRVGGQFKIAGAIYHDLSFLIRYQQQAVRLCRSQPEV